MHNDALEEMAEERKKRVPGSRSIGHFHAGQARGKGKEGNWLRSRVGGVHVDYVSTRYYSVVMYTLIRSILGTAIPLPTKAMDVHLEVRSLFFHYLSVCSFELTNLVNRQRSLSLSASRPG